MQVIRARNVNDAYVKGYEFFEKFDFPKIPSRGGEVMEAPFPVTTEYEFPTERVLFDEVRDANPFFHLFEALWMIAGRDDVGFLKQFSEQASNLIVGSSSYGYRWRHHFHFDQLKAVIRLLLEDPMTRRAVVCMWDPKSDLGSNLKDIPCNDAILFSLRRGVLDMQVFCRSNDMIWGAYGANAVHFSILQEYVASMLGADVGRYWQISANYHVYTNLFYRKKPVPLDCPYASSKVSEIPLVDVPAAFNIELMDFLERMETEDDCKNHFLRCTAEPIWNAWRMWKNGAKAAAIDSLTTVSAPDWQLACRRWMERRA